MSTEHAQNLDTIDEEKRAPICTSPGETELVDLKSTQSLEVATPGDGQFKGQTSPTHTQLPPKSSPADSAEIPSASDTEGYVMSIPLQLVRLSRRSKSRSSSKDYGGQSVFTFGSHVNQKYICACVGLY